jgi:hypothetical protein
MNNDQSLAAARRGLRDKKKPGFSLHDGLNVKAEKPGFCVVQFAGVIASSEGAKQSLCATMRLLRRILRLRSRKRCSAQDASRNDDGL